MSLLGDEFYSSCPTNSLTIFVFFTAGKHRKEYATCHSPLMYLSPLLCGRLTPTQKPVFSLSTRAQVAGGGKVELQQQLPQFKSRSQGEDTLSLTKYTYTTVCSVDMYGLYSEV